MATAKKATRKNPTGRKLGRPTNASRVAASQASFANLLELVGVAASNAAQGAIQAAVAAGQLPGMVTTITPNTSAKTSTSGTQSGTKDKKAPGRNPDPTSNRFKARAMYAELKGKFPRNEIVNKMVESLGLKKNVANTYYHEAERDAGDKPKGRRPRATGVAKKASAAA